MSQPFLGEIRLFAFGFNPRGWALCNGAALSIAQNQALFSILGTTYGGNGQTTFALPDLQGRIPVHFNVNVPATLGTKGGEEIHVLTVAELPAHSHPVIASSNLPSQPGPSGNMWANGGGAIPYADAANASMAAAAVAPAGGGQAHQNLAPYLVLNFCIAVQGIFPSQV